MPPHPPVSPLNFWQVFGSGKALGPGHYQNWPVFDDQLVHPYFGNALDLGLYPKHITWFQYLVLFITYHLSNIKYQGAP